MEPTEDSLSNLEDLRDQLTSRLALLTVGCAGFCLWITTLLKPFPVKSAIYFAILFGLGLVIRPVAARSAMAARHLLIWGLAAELASAMWIYDNPGLPFMGASLLFIGAVLIAWSEWFTAAGILFMAYWLDSMGVRDYPVPELSASFALALIAAWLVIHSLHTALQWTWTMQQQANQLLEDSRTHRGQLSQAVKSYELANGMLRQTERELIAARRQSEKARRSKEEFAANISHELRTPLNLIFGFSEVIYRSPEVYGTFNWPVTLRRDIRQIYQSSRHLMELIDDILDLSRFEMMGFTLTKEPTDLVSLCEGTVEIVRDMFSSNHIQLHVDLPADLPILEIDRTRIRQVLLNLLNNALRFTEEGAVGLCVRRDQGKVVVDISDSGPGILQRDIDHIFEEFYQVDSSIRRNNQGAGLGLAICKHFVNAHDGEIWVDSDIGRGSTFHFSLPIPNEHIPLSRPHINNAVEPPYFKNRPRVLMIDSDPTAAALVQRHLDKYEVVHATDPAMISEQTSLHQPRVIICNNMPPMNGRAAWAPRDIPVIYCSLSAQSWMAREPGIRASLTKPITARQLLEVLQPLDSLHKVLIVDDDIGFCELVERILQSDRRTYTVQHAYSGREGLEVIRAWQPDLVLLDLIMPDGDGFEVLASMREEDLLTRVAVILLTATDNTNAQPQEENPIVIGRSTGLQSSEILRCIHTIVDQFPPAPREEPHNGVNGGV